MRVPHALLLATLVAAALAGTTDAAPERHSGSIVYWRESPIPSIWAVRPDGSHNHRILRSRQNAKRARLSPDRRWVAFDGAPPGKRPLTDFDIQIVRANGKDRRTLTSSRDWDTDAQWSPDGKWLTFTRSPPRPLDCTDHSIWIVRRDGADARRVVDGCTARWSPDGTRLVYASNDGRNLFVIPTTGGASRLLLSGPEDAYQEPAGWSPDGTKILLTRSTLRNGERGDVFVVNPDGTGVRRLARGFAGSWSPDGKRIVYTSSFFSGLMVMNADGSHRHQVVGAQASQPDWR